ncbi:MAG: hypothetical protein AB8B69_01440, partial [Chitinophagales bacterium]
YLWSTGETTQTIAVNPVTATDYFVTVSNGFGCSSTSSTDVVVNPLPIAVATGGAICNGESISLTVSGGTSYLWSNGATSSAVLVSPTVDTNYTVTVTNTNGCTDTTITSVIVNEIPLIEFGTLADSYCEDQAVILITASPVGGTFTSTATTGFNDNGNGTAILVPIGSGAGTFDMTYSFSSSDGCSQTASETIVILPIPDISFISADCSTDLQTYDVVISSNALTIDTNEGIVTDNLDGTFTISGIAAGNNVSIEGLGEDDECERTLEVNAPDCSCPNIAAPVSVNGEVIGYCAGDLIPTLIVTVGTGFTVDWYDAPIAGNLLSSNNLNFTSLTTGTFYAETRDPANDCISNVRTAITLLVNGLPNVGFAGLNENYCVDDETTILTGSPLGGTFTSTLSSGFTDNGNGTAELNPSLAGIGAFDITYTFTDGNGCTDSETQSFNIAEVPIVSFAGLATTYCENDEVIILTGSSNNGIFSSTGNGLIDNGNGTASFNLSQAGVGTFEITYTASNAANCTDSQSQTVTINALPTLTLDGLSNNYCEDEEAVILTANLPNGVFSTNAPNGLVDNGNGTASFNPSISGTGTYQVAYTFTDFNGCTNSITESFNVNALPVLTLSGLGSSYCENDELVTINANLSNGVFSTDAPNGFVDNGNGTATFNPALSGIGNYQITYTFTDPNGCSNSISESFNVTALPVLTLDGLGDNYCEDDGAIVLTASPANGVFSTDALDGLVDNGNGTASFNPSESGTGNYEITYTFTGVNGCSNSISQSFNVNALPALTLSGLANTYCEENEIINIIGNPSNGVFSTDALGGLVDNGDGTASFNPSLAGVGNYEIAYTVTDANACSNSIAQNVSVIDLPIIEPIDTICNNTETYSINLNVNTANIEVSEGVVTNNGLGNFTIEGIAVGNDLTITATIGGITDCSTTLTILSPDCPCANNEAPISEGDIAVCEGEVIPNLSVIVEAGQTVDWYDTAIGGTLLLEGNTEFATTEIGTYYAEARNVLDDCVSTNRTAVSLSVFSLPTVNVDGLAENYCA